jgi:hypothetical protein
MQYNAKAPYIVETHWQIEEVLDGDSIIISHRFTKMKKEIRKSHKKDMTKENGCTSPLYGEKSKCVLHIVPQAHKCETLQIDNKCIKKKLDI